ncbi:hypothetical protein SLE2022_083600 [Rubroshorea leprosula]
MASLSFSLTQPSMVKASPSPTSTLSVPETLDEQFGIEFMETYSMPFVELTDRNGSLLRPGMPDAHVYLSCTTGTPSINYIISLNPLSMATAVVVKNNGRKDMTLTSALFSNVKFKSRGGTAVQGLGGCSYCTHPPLSSFELLSPFEAMQSQPGGWFGFDSEEKHGVIWKRKQKGLKTLLQGNKNWLRGHIYLFSPGSMSEKGAQVIQHHNM